MRYLVLLLLIAPLAAISLGEQSVAFASSLLLWLFYVGAVWLGQPAKTKSVPVYGIAKHFLVINRRAKQFFCPANEKFISVLTSLTTGVQSKSFLLWAAKTLIAAFVLAMMTPCLLVSIAEMKMPYMPSGYPNPLLYAFPNVHAVFAFSVYAYLVVDHVSVRKPNIREEVIQPTLVTFVILAILLQFSMSSEDDTYSMILCYMAPLVLLANPFISSFLYQRNKNKTNEQAMSSKNIIAEAAGLQLITVLAMFVMGLIFISTHYNFRSALFNPDYSYQSKDGKKPSVNHFLNGIDGTYYRFDYKTMSLMKEARNNYIIEDAPEISEFGGLTQSYYDALQGAHTSAILFADKTTSIDKELVPIQIKRLNAIYSAIDYQLTQRSVPSDSLTKEERNSISELSDRYQLIENWKADKPIDGASMKLAVAGQYELFWAHYQKYQDIIEMTSEEMKSKGIKNNHMFSNILAETLYSSGFKPGFKLRLQETFDARLEERRAEVMPYYKHLDEIDKRHGIIL